MDSKARILEMLSQNPNASVSGAEMAARIGISRNAVCKAVNCLKKEGWEIESSTNKGYTLKNTDLLEPQFIADIIAKEGRKAPKIFFESVADSTNAIARTKATEGDEEGTLVLADTQTSGRGRKGREFVSPMGSGIYMSIILRPNFSAEESLFITTAAAVAAARAIEKICGVKTGVKWVNDVYCGEKKVCGILTEAALNIESGGMEYAVLGVGINVYPPKGGFPENLRNIAGVCLDCAPTPLLRSRLVAAFYGEFFAIYEKGCGREFMNEYRSRSNVIGKNVTVFRGNECYDAKAVDIDERGGLVVERNGEKEVLSSGEITIRSKIN